MKLKTPTFPRRGEQTDAAGASAAPPMGPAPAATPPPPAPSSNAPLGGSGPVSPLRRAAPAPSAPARQRNAAVMLAGLAFIIIAGAMAASVARSFDDSIDVLVAAGPIAEGQVLTEADFRVVQIAAGEGDIQAVSPTQIGDLVGRVAAGPIGEGSMIHPAQFTVTTSEARVVVGAALDPDQYPANGVKPGDRVRLIEVAGQFDEVAGFSTGNDLGIGEVTDAVRLGQQQMHFSLRVSESIANVVAQRVAQDRLTIALLDESITLEQVDPLEPAQPLIPLQLDPPADAE